MSKLSLLALLLFAGVRLPAAAQTASPLFEIDGDLAGIVRLDLGTPSRTLVLETPEPIYGPLAFTRDGSRLFYQQGNRLYGVSVEGGQTTPLLSVPLGLDADGIGPVLIPAAAGRLILPIQRAPESTFLLLDRETLAVLDTLGTGADDAESLGAYWFDRPVVGRGGDLVYLNVSNTAAVQYRPFSLLTGAVAGPDAVCPTGTTFAYPPTSNEWVVWADPTSDASGMALLAVVPDGLDPALYHFVSCDLETGVLGRPAAVALPSRAQLTADGRRIVASEVVQMPDREAPLSIPGRAYVFDAATGALERRAFPEPGAALYSPEATPDRLFAVPPGQPASAEVDLTMAPTVADLLDYAGHDIDYVVERGWAADDAITDALRAHLDRAYTAASGTDRFGVLGALARLADEANGATALSPDARRLLSTNLGDIVRLASDGYDLRALPAAVAIQGPTTASFRGSAFQIAGAPHTTDGAPADEAPAVGGIQTDTEGAATSVRAGLSPSQTDRVSGASGTGDIQAQPLPFVGSAWADGLASRAGVTVSGRRSDTVGTAEQPVVAYAPSGLTLSGGFRGAGVLVVDGPFEMRGNAEWVGLVLVRGTSAQQAAPDVVGSARIVGGLVLVGTDAAPASLSLAGSASVLYSPEALALARVAALGD